MGNAQPGKWKVLYVVTQTLSWQSEFVLTNITIIGINNTYILTLERTLRPSVTLTSLPAVGIIMADNNPGRTQWTYPDGSVIIFILW